MLKLTGVMPALLTPFDDEGEVNLRVIRDLVEFHLAAGLTGFYILGSTGEGLLLSEAERRLVTETVVDQVKGRVPVVVHVGTLSTRAACDLASTRPGGRGRWYQLHTALLLPRGCGGCQGTL